MATFQKRANGKIRAIVRISGYPPASRIFETEPAARLWAEKLETALRSQENRKRIEDERAKLSSPRLGDAILEFAKQRSVREQRCARGIAQRDISNFRLAAITPKLLSEYRDERLKTVSANSIRIELCLISSLFEWHIERGTDGVTENPKLKVKLPKLPQGRNRRLTEEEEMRLFEAVAKRQNPGFRAIVLLAIETGMRISEILSMRWGWIDRSRSIALLPKTKNGDSREVPLSAASLKALDEVPVRYLADGSQDRIFGYTYDGFSSVWSDAREDAGLSGKNFRFHDLRHEFTSRLFEVYGMNAIEAATLTGHKTMQMLKRYSHLKAEDLGKRMAEIRAKAEYAEPSPTPSSDIEARLQKLKGLFEKGLIDDIEFRDKRAQILHDF